MTLVLGAVAYDPKVVSIWTGFRHWLSRNGLPIEVVLYFHYEHQVEDLAAGRIDVAWNSPLAWARSRRIADATGGTIRPLVMRDTDQDLTSVVVVRAGSSYGSVADLKGETVAVGAADSPQATLIPLAYLAGQGLDVRAGITVRRFDVGVGLHGDHVGGERDAARALVAGEVAAACLLDATHLMLTQEGALPSGSTRVLGRTPPFDHCVLTAGAAAPAGPADRLASLLLSMSYADPEVRPLLDLEGLTKWRPGRTGGFGQIEDAVDELRFYGSDGAILERDYKP
jgi:ABC-type phosphate/phosphonate transport system substrate-binding protein